MMSAPLIRRSIPVVIIGSIGVLYSMPYMLSTFQMGVLVRVTIFALFGIAFNIVFGAGGMPSLGHAAFFGLGGYALGIGGGRLGYGVVGVLVLALVLSGALGFTVGLLTLRTNGIYLLLLTLAVAQAVWGLAFQQVRLTNGDNGIAGLRRELFVFVGEPSLVTFYWSSLSIALVLGLAVWWFQRSPVGVAVLAQRESSSRLAALGYRVEQYRVAAFTVSAVVSGIAGVLYAASNRYVGPENLAWSTSAMVMLFPILGGAAFFFGPVLGAAAIVLLEVWVSGYTQRWLSVLGLTYILTVLFMPKGILGTIDDLWRTRRFRREERARSERVVADGAVLTQEGPE